MLCTGRMYDAYDTSPNSQCCRIKNFSHGWKETRILFFFTLAVFLSIRVNHVLAQAGMLAIRCNTICIASGAQAGTLAIRCNTLWMDTI